MTFPDAIAVGAAIMATGLADYRWWRVAQREHYIAGSVTRFALRWWRLGPNRLLALAALLGTVLAPVSPFTSIVGVVAVGIGPFRYPLRGRAPGPVAWTTRLRTVAGVTAGLQLVAVLLGAAAGAVVPAGAVVALLSPLAIDAALALLRPVEEHKAERFVLQAKARLQEVDPLVIAITGSYGKTTTKSYAAHLIGQATRVVPTPASFNNRAGLSRAVNEHLVPGTEVFIAEMGTYGRGEIAQLCEWCPPAIAAITAIGPVHLERFGNEDAIVTAKSEIFGPAGTAVLNVDDARLAAVADRLEAEGKRVQRVSATDTSADVCVAVADGRMTVSVAGRQVADVADPDAVPTNVAVAVALAVAAGVSPVDLEPALATLPSVANRRMTTTLSTGASAIDDTFNSNPAGCRAALATLARLGAADHRRVVVTPGMVELGPRQADENRRFATEAAIAATDIVVVGFTNRAALLAGVRAAPAEGRAAVVLADTHALAVEWVREHTAAGDVVLYENQLPDHYP